MSNQLATIQSITDLFTANLPKLEKGNLVGKAKLTELLATPITTDEDREAFVASMVQLRTLGDKMKAWRMEVTRPLDELKDQLMSFERDLDDANKSGMFAQAKALIIAYDQAKLEANRKKEAESERQRQITVYKAELNASVGRAVIEMLAGQQRNLIAGMAAWESKLTLETFDEEEKKLNGNKEASLKQDKYDGCFHLNFNRQLILEEETKEYIDSLKLVYPYDIYNKKYAEIVAEIKNTYRAKMPTIKAQLIEAKKNAEAEAKRQADIKAQELANLKASEEKANAAVQEVVNQKDLTTIEADFQKQGQLADVQAGPVKYEASFTNDTLWLKPFLAAVQAVASTGKVNVKKASGEYSTQIDWWLKAFALTGQAVDGITLKEVPKMILKKKKTEGE